LACGPGDRPGLSEVDTAEHSGTETTPQGGVDDGAGAAFGGRIPDRLELSAGESYRLDLPSAAGGGYLWESSLAEGDPGTVRVEIEVGPMSPPGEEPTSAAAPVALVATAARPGSAVWRLRLVRVWQRESPLVDRLLEVVVR